MKNGTYNLSFVMMYTVTRKTGTTVNVPFGERYQYTRYRIYTVIQSCIFRSLTVCEIRHTESNYSAKRADNV